MKSNAFFHGLSKTKFVVYCSLMLAVSMILKLIFEIYFPLGGSLSLRLNLTAIPIYLSGMLFGPGAGCLVGIFSDIFCHLIKPAGPYFIGLTITSGLSGLIPGIMIALIQRFKIKHYSLINTLLVIGSCSAFFFCNSFSFSSGQIQFNGEAINYWLIGALVILMIGFILFPKLYTKIKEKKNNQNNAFIPGDALFFIVSITQLIVSVIGNTICLMILYGQAVAVLLPARIITNFFLIPIYTIILAALLKFTPKNLLPKSSADK